MAYHFKPLFIRAKIDGTPIRKLFIDRGATMNLMSHSLLRNIGKSDVDLQQHNMVLSNYNLLLGREWIHGIDAVPSTLH